MQDDRATTEIRGQGGKRIAWLRWLIWLDCAFLWSFVLLTPRPAVIADSSLGHDLANVASKSLHVCGYAVLTGLSGWLRAPVRVRWLLLIFASAHGFATEYFQSFVQFRTASWRD